jgi:hypothetical protein
MGHPGDFKNEGFRRMLVNSCYWALAMEKQIANSGRVALPSGYDPNPIGIGKQKKGIKPPRRS